MKCIKMIDSENEKEIGRINRINDKEAEVRVRSGMWEYIPKSEWKLATRNTKVSNDEPTEEVEKQTKSSNKKKK